MRREVLKSCTRMADLHRFDPQVQTEDIAFSPDQLVTCECGRANAPNRANCIYCGRTIAAGAVDLAADAHLESWENGVNVVAVPPLKIAPTELARLLDLSEKDAQTLADAQCGIPLGRYRSEAAAGHVADELGARGIPSRLISDESLAINEPLVRLSALEVGEAALTVIDFNTHRRTEISLADLSLLVPGVVITSRSEVVEQRKKRTASVIEETETDSREPMLDLYSKNDSRGFRILLTGFDFSVLGARKGLVGEKNLLGLVEMLRTVCPSARLVDEYPKLRPVLDAVWPVESRTDALGKRNVRIGKSGFAKAATTSNLEQFTRFSRLQWHVL